MKENKINSWKRIPDYKKLLNTKFIKSKRSNKPLKRSKTIVN